MVMPFGMRAPQAQPEPQSPIHINLPATSGPMTVTGFPDVQHVIVDQLPAIAVDVASTALTDQQLRAAPLSVATEFPAVQTIAGAVEVINFPGQVNIGNLPATQAVSGSVDIANLPATQQIAGSVSVSNLPATQDVSVSNFPTTQQVSVANFPATQAITGTVAISNFPVQVGGESVGLTNAELRATPLAVTGDFYPATQTVSGNVVITNFPATQSVAGNVNVSNFPSVQTVLSKTDTGRTQANYFTATEIAATATEAALSLTGSRGLSAIAPIAAIPVITVGKAYRISRIWANYKGLAAATSVAIRIRINPSGLALITSPILATWFLGQPAAVAGVSNSMDLSIPDGMDIPAGAGFIVTIQGYGATGAAAAGGYTSVSITGYEY